MFLFLWLIVFVVGIAVLYNGRERDEELLILKLIGYYFLGTFYIAINGLALPVGFVISLFLKPRDNRGVKRGASIFGLVLMIIGQFIM
ncbi:hypothetical protein ACX1C1_09060 [Paenibacillus sp. strain BS8-2]